MNGPLQGGWTTAINAEVRQLQNRLIVVYGFEQHEVRGRTRGQLTLMLEMAQGLVDDEDYDEERRA